MDFTAETYRSISQVYSYSEYALRRHKENHLIVDLADIHQAMEQARKVALAEVRAKELEDIKIEAKDTVSGKLNNAQSHLDKLDVALHEAADLLDRAKEADDLRAAGVILGRLTDQIKLMAELTGKLQTQPHINVVTSFEWIELRTRILEAIDPFPEAKQAIVNAIRGR